MRQAKANLQQKASRSTLYAGLLLSMLAVVVVVYIWLKPSYGEVSKQGFEYAMAMVSACNRKDQARITVIAESVNRDLAESKLPPSDEVVLLKIMRFAQEGDGKIATVEARELLDSQVDSKLASQAD